MYKNLRHRKGKRANTHCKARWSGGIIRNSNQQTWEAFLCNCLYMGHSCCFHIITWVKIIMCNNYCAVYLKIQRQIYKCSHPSFGAVCFLTVLLFVHFLVYLYKQADTPRFNVCFFFVILKICQKYFCFYPALLNVQTSQIQKGYRVGQKKIKYLFCSQVTDHCLNVLIQNPKSLMLLQLI